MIDSQTTWAAHMARHRAKLHASWTGADLNNAHVNQKTVYTNAMTEPAICTSCTRTADSVNAQGQCYECEEWSNAQATLASGTVLEPSEINAISEYIEQMKTQANAKGGKLETKAKGNAIGTAKKRASRAMGVRGPGRPELPEDERLLPKTYRLRKGQIDKVEKMGGRDWLSTIIDLA